MRTISCNGKINSRGNYRYDDNRDRSGRVNRSSDGYNRNNSRFDDYGGGNRSGDGYNRNGGSRFDDYGGYRSGDGYNRNDGSRFDDYGGRQRPICQVCDKVGHTAKMCWYRYEKDENYRPRNYAFRPRFENSYSKGNNSSQVKPQPQQQTQALLATPANLQDQNWYLDSGATHHMTADEQNLVQKETYDGSDQVIIGNGSGN